MDPSEQVRLGSTRVTISRLGLGMAALGDRRRVSDADAITVIARARALGLLQVDTAPEYGIGLAEQRLGAAIEAIGPGETVISTKVGRLIRPADRAQRIRHTLAETVTSPAGVRLLASKLVGVAHRSLPFGAAAPARGMSAGANLPTPGADLGSVPAAVCDFSYDGVMRSLEESYRRLGTERVAIAFIHEPDLHERQASTGAYRALERLRRDGTVGAIGVAMNDPAALARFAQRGDYDCFLLGGRYTLLEQEAIERLLPSALARGISIILGGPFNSGILAAPGAGARYNHRPADRRRIERAVRIASVCARHGVPIRAAAARFPLGHPAVVSVVVGAASVAEIEESADLFQTAIPDDLWAELRHEGLLRADVPTPTG